ncbi:MAG: hypothetical protein AAF639_19730 [Chloroflexota bacterium]
MKSRTTRSFREAYRNLPTEVQERTRKAYQLWRANPNLPGLRYKRVNNSVSVRIGRTYRALGWIEGDTVYWYWIGHHRQYDRILER